MLGSEIGQTETAAAKPGKLSGGARLKIEKSFAFQKTENGTWRCDISALPPIDVRIAAGGP